MSDNEKINQAEDDIKIKSPFMTKLENFFYHYKWHTIAAIFIIFTVTIASLQMCQKKSYDIHILYAGGTNVSKSVETGNAESEYESLLNAMKPYVEDYDNDGSKSINLSCLYIPTEEQIAELEKEPGVSINYTLLSENKSTFNQNMLFGDYYIALISKSLLDDLTSKEDNNPLAPIKHYLPDNYEGKGYRTAGEFGVYLSSTPLAKKPGFSSLEEDTVIVIRRFPEVAQNKRSREFYARSEEILKLMIG